MPPRRPTQQTRTLAQVVRSAGVEQKRKSLWQGPEKDGITFSLLSKFLVCKERFRLKVVEGLADESEFDSVMEYGSMWHQAEEAYAGGKDWVRAIRAYRKQLLIDHPEQAKDIDKWTQICEMQFPLYINHWANHPSEKKRIPIAEEQEFNILYPLPSGRTVRLRGKIDALFQVPPSIYNQENKTKGKVDEEGVTKTLFGNLQTMFYQIVTRLAYQAPHGHVGFDWGVGKSVHMHHVLTKTKVVPKIAGVRYNIVRRPLGEFQKHCIRQRKNESPDQFLGRLADLIKENADYFFMRWTCLLSDHDVLTFKRRVFDPILEHLCDWWEWIEPYPFDPWRENLMAKQPVNRVHFQSPWGVYNSLGNGFRGDYFPLLTSGDRSTLRPITNLFPELS